MFLNGYCLWFVVNNARAAKTLIGGWELLGIYHLAVGVLYGAKRGLREGL